MQYTASNDSLLEPLSNFVDYFIEPYVPPSYIKYSTDVINKISEMKDLPGDTVILDVESLYTTYPMSEDEML